MDYSLWLISLYTCLAMLTLIYRKFLLKYMCEINSLSSKFPWIIIYYLITERSPFKFYTKSNTDDPKHQRWLDPFRKGRPHPWKGSVFGRWPHTKVLDLPFSHLALQAAAAEQLAHTTGATVLPTNNMVCDAARFTANLGMDKLRAHQNSEL